MLEVAQTAMDQLGRSRGGRLRQVAALDQQNPPAAAGGVAGDAGAIDAAADDQQVEVGRQIPAAQSLGT